MAAGKPDAPRPHLAALLRALDAPPLEDVDRDILRLLALGCSQREIKGVLLLSERTLQRNVAVLTRLFDARSGPHLGAIAVQLGLGRAWEGEPATD